MVMSRPVYCTCQENRIGTVKLSLYGDLFRVDTTLIFNVKISMTIGAQIIYLRAAGVSLVIDARSESLPHIVHWGSDLGDLGNPGTEAEQLQLAQFLNMAQAPLNGGQIDVPIVMASVPMPCDGWSGTPGLEGNRNGKAFSPRFVVTQLAVERGVSAGSTKAEPENAADIASELGADLVRITASDLEAGLELQLDLELLSTGVVRQRAAITNTGSGDYQLSSLNLSLPLPAQAEEILDFTGRWIRERAPQRKPFTFGTHTREIRKGRSHDATVLVLAGESGFTYETGEVWGLHVGWSGNQRIIAERTVTGQTQFLGGELLLSGEVILPTGGSYESPWVYGSYGSRANGLNELSTRFHQIIRSRKTAPRKPRPVHINVWEAVYFNHDLDVLKGLADQAATVGVERYVLDDGWFTGRRDDTSGLGDWYVDQDVWPQGLGPIVDHVTGLGMEFGLWFEPEMINPNSNLARLHPDWILAPSSERLPLPARSQQVLNLAIPQAFDYILERIDTILNDHDISYVKWDHNRELIESGNLHTGVAGVHEQTRALYRLFAELKRRHPDVEFETCAGGGGRVDLGILAFTDRMWASDCIDALERQQIEVNTGLLVPPEILGSHIGSGIAHTTGRRHELAFRATTAMFGHMGIEWNLNEATDAERTDLAQWIALYKEHRELLHSGEVVRIAQPDPQHWVHGVVSTDKREAVFASTQLGTSYTSAPGRTRLVGLDPTMTYEVVGFGPNVDLEYQPAAWKPAWWGTPGLATGRMLMDGGLQLPAQRPEHTVLFSLKARP